MRSHLQYVVVAATMLAALAAVLPIAAAIVTGRGGGAVARTAFATAPSGNYAVVSRPERDFDVIAVVPSGGGEPVEVARVSHLPGFTSTGAVSADGRRLAVITADAGSLTRPRASLLVVELETGSVRSLAADVDPLQTPVWSPGGRSVVAARVIEDGDAQPTVRFLTVPVDGSGASTLYDVRGALGAWAVGFEPDGGLIGVTINGTGSHLTRDGAYLFRFSGEITRDWRLSPDGGQLAYIETNLDSGLRYVGGTVSLKGGAARAVEALSEPGARHLGVAWRPGADAATFGRLPAEASGSSEVGRVERLTSAGFDVPLDYSKDGAALAVERWSGTSFANPGESSLEIVTESGRFEVGAQSRFLGWTAR
ncbi:MAG: hypothetical protein C0506_01715 [Anaerolinea sp.]|nr:hypothetical protein [Anaerolinea sp.]